MTTVKNRTRYAAAAVIGRDAASRLAMFLSVKATFSWDRSGMLSPVEGTTVALEDELVGAGPTASILRAAEVGPAKPRIDVLLAGAIVFPVPVDEVDVTLEVGTRISKTVRVTGERIWVPGLVRELVPSKPRPVTRVPVDWTRAFGGTDPEDPGLLDPRNPAGSGVARNVKALEGQTAPSFEAPGKPIESWKSRPTPQGFGPIAAHWQPRASRAGTYDERWRRERFPLLPADFDPRFHNVAPDDQQLPTYIEDEEVRLTYMTLTVRDRFRLPRLAPSVLFATADALVERVATVDTIVIEPEARHLCLIARATCPLRSDSLVVHEVVIGSPTAGHRRALELGKRHLQWRRREMPGDAPGDRLSQIQIFDAQNRERKTS